MNARSVWMGIGIEFVLLFVTLMAPASGTDLGTAFTYQGRLVVNGSPANGIYDFQIILYDAASGGSALGTENVYDLSVTGGLFTAELDFGDAVITGQARWLVIGVRPGASTGEYTWLNPRQRLSAVPHALTLPAVRVKQATSANIIGGHPDNSVNTGVVGATIVGGGSSGEPQLVQSDFGAIGGGRDNIVSGTGSVIAGGSWNTTTGAHAVVAGGGNNTAAVVSFVGGGSDNEAVGTYSVISGGILNSAVGDWSAIGGGQSNQVNENNDTVSGGLANVANGPEATISGGKNNTASGTGSVIGGGSGNTTTGAHAVVAGGGDNTAAVVSFVGGGSDNEALGTYAVIGGGILNTVSGSWSTIAGGQSNSVTGNSATVGGGLSNAAGGTGATIPGGGFNTANGSYSFAAGYRAKASHTGSFVLTDSTEADFASVRADALRARFNGGVTFQVNSGSWFRVLNESGRVVDTSTGAYLSTGGTWTNGSRRSAKEEFAAVDPAEVLEQVAALPVQRWKYIAEEGAVRHIGPTAEDFQAAFGVGVGDGIATVDADGVALAAIQALNSRIKSLEAENRALAARLAALEARGARSRRGGVGAAKGQ